MKYSDEEVLQLVKLNPGYGISRFIEQLYPNTHKKAELRFRFTMILDDFLRENGEDLYAELQNPEHTRHNYSGEKSETLQGEESQKIDYRRSFSPLIGIKLVPKNWPLNINLNFNNTLNIENTGLSTERKTSEQINITFDYRRDGGIQIPIFFLRDFEIENKIDLKLTLGYDKSQTDYSSSTVGSFETTAFSNSFNIKPEITYSFSKYIDGNLYVNYSVSETHTTGTKETTDIGFKVKIVFESFK